MAEVVALQSMFEGLFVRALTPNAAFKEKLLAQGFDLARQRTRYPIEVWVTCVDLAALEYYPGLAREPAWVQLGRRFIEGYFQTLVGRMIGASLPFLSPKSFIGRVPRFMTTGMEGSRVELVWHDPANATVRVLGPGEMGAALLAGVLAVCFERMGVAPVKLEPKSLGGLDSELHIGVPVKVPKP